jgi:hypothetical protein
LEKEYVNIDTLMNQARIAYSHLIRKDKPIGRTFGGPFVWDDALDAAADVYNGVSDIAQARSLSLMRS